MSGTTSQRVVVVAVDNSDNAKAALNWYLNEVYRKDDTVVICHVPESPDLSAISFRRVLSPPVEEWQKILTDHLEKIKRLEESYEAELANKKIQYKFCREMCAKPGQGIINVVESEKASLVVIGTRGLDAFRRTLLGSVSEFVVRQSRVPVLVCPSPS